MSAVSLASSPDLRAQFPKTSFVDTKIQEAYAKASFPLPNIHVLFHADAFYNLRGNPSYKLQLSDEVKWQLLFAASAHKDNNGIAHLGENFTVKHLHVRDLVLLYRIFHSYISSEHCKNPQKEVFYRHTFEIEQRLCEMRSFGVQAEEAVFLALKESPDTTLESLTFNVTSDDPVFIQIRSSLVMLCQQKVGTPEYLVRVTQLQKLEEAYRLRNVSNQTLETAQQELAAAKTQLAAKERMYNAVSSANNSLERYIVGLEADVSEKEQLEAGLREAQESYRSQVRQIKQLEGKVAGLTKTHAAEKAELGRQIADLQSRISLLQVGSTDPKAIDKILMSQSRAAALIEQLLVDIDDLPVAEDELHQQMEILVQRMSAANQLFTPSIVEKNHAVQRVHSLRAKTDKAMDDLKEKHRQEVIKHEKEIVVHESRYESMTAIMTGMTTTLSSTQDHVKALEEQVRKMGGKPVEIVEPKRK